MKNIIITISITVLLGVYQTTVQAVGLGITLSTFGGTIYFPINKTPNMRVEPFISYYLSERDDSKDSANNGKQNSLNSHSNLSLGSGFFNLTSINQNTVAYYGSRLAISYGKSKYRYNNDTYESTDNTTSIGLMISPLLGVEYWFNDVFSISLEAGGSLTIENSKTTSENIKPETYTEKSSEKYLFFTSLSQFVIRAVY